MCGISGQLSWTTPPDRGLVERMTCAIAHRGPDGHGVYVEGPVAFGHRRLAIIDLSSGGDQPMRDGGGRCTIVFNGEIYNYRELRKDLSAAGAVFRSQSDTEVILAAYLQWGPAALSRLNGMFALALWDAHERSLLLARDRLGKKPLYYREHADGGVTFASEIKSLTEDASFDRRLNARALSQYLSLNYTLTSDAILHGVRKLPPGHYRVFAERRTTPPVMYWDVAESFRRRTSHRTPEAAADELRSLLDEAVRIRLVSDVPLGLFLSGGIDSTTLAAAMCQSLPPRDVRSFSMGFEHASYNEVAEARQTADALGITHQDMVTKADAASMLERIVYHGDEPFADSSLIPTYLLSQFARQHVTVCLAGDGGDEVFAGYETYVADRLHHWSRWVPKPVMRAVAAATGAVLPVSFDKVSLDYKVRQFLGAHGCSDAEAHYHWRRIFSEREKQELLHPDVRAAVAQHDPFDEFARFDRELAGADYLSRSLYVDLKTWLVDDILVKADRASMAHGLEIRTPFLDYRVVEFAAALPAEWKLHGLDKKYVLKLSQRDRVPAPVLRRRKQGFNAPVAHWLLASFRTEFEAMMTSETANGTPLLNRAFVKKLWDEHVAGRRDNGHRLLGLITLQLWCRRFQPQGLA
ncbi:MAG TPA: asparagine synthase (glutamine-hydrolyzing) [Vicinamibacterales bacterium]|nr:asparagine synthase (glutamine-hydrolyzing) [Vicinamibacterales bacterium]